MASPSFSLNHYEPATTGQPPLTFKSLTLTVNKDNPSTTSLVYLGNDGRLHFTAFLNNQARLETLPPLLTQTTPSTPVDTSIITDIDVSAASLTSSISLTSLPSVASFFTVSTSSSLTTQNINVPSVTSTLSVTSASVVASSRTSNDGLSTGTIAGIIIGVAVGFGSIIFLITYLCLRRRQRGSKKLQATTYPMTNDDEKKAVNRHVISGKHPPKMTIEQIAVATAQAVAPQAADDRTVATKATTLLDHIELFIENFYDQSSHSSATSSNSELSLFDSPLPGHILQSLLSTTKNALPLITHALVHRMVISLSGNSSIEESFLPPEFVSMLRRCEGENNSSALKPDHMKLLSSWRILSASLCPNISKDQAYIDQRNARIHKASHAFLQSFQKWAKPSFSNDERLRSLVAIYREAAELGLFLFSQPSDIHFHWPDQMETGTTKAAILPSLVKLADEHGKPLANAQVLVKPTLQRL